MAEMTNEQAARVLMEHAEEIEKYMAQCEPMIECATALRMGAAALNGDLGWEFIIFMLEKNYPEDIFGGFDDLGGRTLKAIRWLEKERAALRGPIPDPVTGLVPCGCGGKARLTNHDLRDSYMTVIRCASCGIEAGYVGIDSTKATKKKAETRWNRAMGYKEDA